MVAERMELWTKDHSGLIAGRAFVVHTRSDPERAVRMAGALLDYLVRPHKNRLRRSDADRFCGSHVDRHLDRCRQFHGQIGRLCAFKYLVDITCEVRVGVVQVGTIGNEDWLSANGSIPRPSATCLRPNAAMLSRCSKVGASGKITTA
jgi:hypothetical protein